MLLEVTFKDPPLVPVNCMYEHKQGSLYASLSNLGRVYSCVELFCTIFGFGNQTVYNII